MSIVPVMHHRHGDEVSIDLAGSQEEAIRTVELGSDRHTTERQFDFRWSGDNVIHFQFRIRIRNLWERDVDNEQRSARRKQ